jgi:PTH1 family peptidyl-tRNA hydrolase
LGNPGQEYEGHRHNIGFMLLDRLASQHGLAFSLVQHEALVARGRIAGQSVILSKPQTFMNRSGQAVGRLVHLYQIPLECLLIVFDDLDLPLGSLRLREGGGAGGHKGMLSIVERLGPGSVPRLRLGIGRPPGQMDPSEYVLRSFRTNERPLLEQVISDATAGVLTFLSEGIALAMARHNRTTDGAGGEDSPQRGSACE